MNQDALLNQVARKGPDFQPPDRTPSLPLSFPFLFLIFKADMRDQIRSHRTFWSDAFGGATALNARDAKSCLVYAPAVRMPGVAIRRVLLSMFPVTSIVSIQVYPQLHAGLWSNNLHFFLDGRERRRKKMASVFHSQLAFVNERFKINIQKMSHFRNTAWVAQEESTSHTASHA